MPRGMSSALDVADEVELGGLDERARAPRRRAGGPLPASVPFESSATRGRRFCETQLRVGRAHHGEADEILGGRVDRRADVEDQRERIVLLAAAQLGRVDGGERGAPHALEQRPAARAREHATRRCCRRRRAHRLRRARRDRAATAIDASGLAASASAGFSSISTNVGAWWTRTRAPSWRMRGSRRPSTAASPTRMISALGSASDASAAPRTISSGAWSPPIASTTMRCMRAHLAMNSRIAPSG